MINFLDLTPKPATETVTLETASGTAAEIELSGLSLETLSELAKRFPSFGSLIEGGDGSFITASDAIPALIAASLGHVGSPEYEAKARGLNARDMLTMLRVIMRLTLPQPSEVSRPLPVEPARLNGAAVPEQTLQLPSNS